MTTQFDNRYAKTEHVYGKEPEKILVDHYTLMDNSKVVLDVGAGQGRHSIFLAEHGYGVEALEPSEVGLKQIEKIAVKRSLPIFLTHGDTENFEPKTESYGGILLFGILQIVTREQISRLLDNLKLWTGPGSIVFITAFTVDEPSFDKHLKTDKEIGIHSFEDSSGFIRTYLEIGELKTMFSDWEEVYYNELLTPPHHHGDGNEHQHALAEAVFKR